MPVHITMPLSLSALCLLYNIFSKKKERATPYTSVSCIIDNNFIGDKVNVLGAIGEAFIGEPGAQEVQSGQGHFLAVWLLMGHQQLYRHILQM